VLNCCYGADIRRFYIVFGMDRRRVDRMENSKGFSVVIAGCIEIILLSGQKISERLIALKFLTENLINDVADGCLFLTDKGRSLLLRGWPYFVGR